MATPEIVVIIIAVVLLSGFRIAQEYQHGVVFRLGRRGVWRSSDSR
jgi:regulator of protease activity HflC (stomatin/prohibitin superfamily)